MSNLYILRVYATSNSSVVSFIDCTCANLVLTRGVAQDFMKGMLAQRQVVATNTDISAAVQGYHAFLQRMRLHPSGLQPPSRLIDLVWHTHQQHPARYANVILAHLLPCTLRSFHVRHFELLSTQKN